MFTELNSILNASPDTITQGEFILISDRKSDASFLIHHFLTFYLKGCQLITGQRKRSAGLPGGTERVAVCFESSRNQHRESSGPRRRSHGLPQRSCRRPEEPLRVRSVQFEQFQGSDGAEEWGPPVLLVDDLSVLLSLGVSVGAVLDFSHYCRVTVCSQLKGNVAMLARCDGEEEEDDGDDEGSERLLKGLTHQCSLTLHVQGLPTGYCRDIHGQVEVCWRRRRQCEGKYTQKKLFQYKVHDKGASFFAPGTSSAVL
uniref:Elongator complex protein 6 n=1 Tax=Labrus bergylta TaxID=56723 RepID=A0A3Q3H1V1_9LABR